jgi:hypothetical protein
VGMPPQIMMVIEKVSGIEFLKDHEITDFKSQFLTAPIITMDVPSTSAAPRSTRSSTAAPPPTTSSSSSDGDLRVLKSMFAWCRDTHQCQDVLLSNQRRQNKKMGPFADENPFASLFTANLATMEAAPADDDDDSSEYEEGGNDDKEE